MNVRLATLALIVCAFAFSSCRREPGNDVAATGQTQAGAPQAGALYSLNDGEGGYRVGRVVAAEDEVVFVSLFANRWTKRPAAAEARQLATPVGLAYSAETFAGMQPVLLEAGTTTDEELEAYESWKLGKRETF